MPIAPGQLTLAQNARNISDIVIIKETLAELDDEELTALDLEKKIQ